MKKLSLKIKISLWFTLILTIICILMLMIAFSAYRNADEKQICESLMDAVADEVLLLEEDKSFLDRLESGRIKESEFLKEEIRLMVYSKDEEQIAGLFLYGELNGTGFTKSDSPVAVSISGEKYYYYDEWVHVRHGEDYWVRGVVKAKKSVWYIFKRHGNVVAIVPILIIIAFLGGCILTGQFLRPIRKIDETAEEIRKSGDLSKRIPVSGGRDEITSLALHINTMFDRLEENFEAERRFASNASHELRTPVSVILAQCEYAFDNASSQEDLYNVISAVQKQGYKMSHLIETLLLFTRMEQDTEKYRKEKNDISEIVRSVCEDYGLLAQNIKIEAEIQDEVWGNVNRELFTLMISNLLQNALRYGKENGHVLVELKREDEKVLLTVSDDGIGISKEDLPHIWELFYRSDQSRTSKGLGLGLPLVKQIVEYHGGEISVKSAVGEGTTFCVKIAGIFLPIPL